MPKRIASIVAAALLMPSLALAQESGWRPYADTTYGFTAELPLDTFTMVDSSDVPGVSLAEIGGDARINFYGGPAEGITRDALETRFVNGEQTITYRAGGESWFVLSGFYDSANAAEPMIFYTKVLFSADQRTFSAFEINFPAAEKPRFAPIVETFEDNFTRPR